MVLPGSCCAVDSVIEYCRRKFEVLGINGWGAVIGDLLPGYSDITISSAATKVMAAAGEVAEA